MASATLRADLISFPIINESQGNASILKEEKKTKTRVIDLT